MPDPCFVTCAPIVRQLVRQSRKVFLSALSNPANLMFNVFFVLPVWGLSLRAPLCDRRPSPYRHSPCACRLQRFSKRDERINSEEANRKSKSSVSIVSEGRCDCGLREKSRIRHYDGPVASISERGVSRRIMPSMDWPARLAPEAKTRLPMKRACLMRSNARRWPV